MGPASGHGLECHLAGGIAMQALATGPGFEDGIADQARRGDSFLKISPAGPFDTGRRGRAERILTDLPSAGCMRIAVDPGCCVWVHLFLSLFMRRLPGGPWAAFANFRAQTCISQ